MVMNGGWFMALLYQQYTYHQIPEAGTQETDFQQIEVLGG